MNVAALARVSLERELRRAIESNEFTPLVPAAARPAHAAASPAPRRCCAGRSRAADAHAGRFHPARGGNGAHRADRRMGAARGVPAIPRLAGRGNRAAARRRQRLDPAIPAAGVRRDACGSILRSDGHGAAMPRARDHRRAAARDEPRGRRAARAAARDGRDASASTISAPATRRSRASSAFRWRPSRSIAPSSRTWAPTTNRAALPRRSSPRRTRCASGSWPKAWKRSGRRRYSRASAAITCRVISAAVRSTRATSRST